MKDGPAKPRRVLISYAHESDEHRGQVLALAQRLRSEGVDAWLDRFEPHPSDWALWMRREVDKADVVLCVCTAMWRHRYDAEEDDGVDTGVRYEGKLLRGLMLESRGRGHKAVAVVFSEDDRRHHVPRDLSSGTVYLLDGDYQRLYDHLTGQANVKPAPLGLVKVRSDGTRGKEPRASLTVLHLADLG